MAQRERKPLAQITITSLSQPKDVVEERTAALEFAHDLVQAAVNEGGIPLEVQNTADGSSATILPETQHQQSNRRGKSFSLSSVSPEKYEQIFGHTGFKQ